MASEEKRLFVGGLFEGVDKTDLKERFGQFGTVTDVDVRKRLDDEGNPIKVFAYVNIQITEQNYKKCMQLYNRTKWRGREVQIQVAKESFMDRLQRERQATEQAAIIQSEMVPEPKPSHEDVQKLKVKGAAPGTAIEGKQDWVVGKYGRPMPVVKIRRKDKTKVVKIDPSNYTHTIKKLEGDSQDVSQRVSNLSWFFEEDSQQQKPVNGRSTTESSSSSDSSDEDGSNVKKRKRKRTADATVNKAKKTPSTNVVSKKQRKSQSSSSEKSSSELSSDESTQKSQTKKQTLAEDNVLSNKSESNDFEVVSINTKLNGQHDDSDSADTDELFTQRKGGKTDKKESKASRKPTVSVSSSNEKTGKMVKKSKTVVKSTMSSSSKSDTLNSGSDTSLSESETSASDSDVENSLKSADKKGTKKQQSSVPIAEPPKQKEMPILKGRQRKEDEADPYDSSDSETPADILKRRMANKDSANSSSGASLSERKQEKKELGAKKTSDWIEKSDDRKLGAKKSFDAMEKSDERKLDQSQSKRIKNSDTENLEKKKETTVTPSIKVPTVKAAKGSKVVAVDKILGGMAANDEFYSGHETFGDNKEESDEEEEDLLDLVASGQLSKLKKLAKEVEESAGRPQLATPKLKSDKGQNKTAKTSVAKTSSDSPSDVQQTSGKEATESQQVTEKKDKKKKKDEKKKDEKNKDEKNTFMSKEEKHALANEKRLESLKLRQKAHLSHKKLIQSALQSVDQPESSKKIVFDSDSEDDVGQSSSMMDTVGMEPEKSNLKKKEEDSESDSEESSSQEEQLKAKSSSQMAGLFESESESGDEDEDEDIFRIRPEKEGKTGRKLMALQNRLGGDTRFKMDESFLEEEEEKEEEKKEEKDMEVDEEGKDEGEGVTETEKQKSMAILAGIVGSKVARREKRQTYRDMTSIQYDPAKPGHERLEVTREPKPKKQKVTKEEVTPTQKNLEPELPEVSKDRYFSVTSSLKDVFAKDTGFSFNFSVDNQESSSLQAANESAASEKIETKNQMMNPWSQKQFSYESCDDEDAGDKVEDKSSGVSTDKEKDTNKTKSKGWGWSKDSFFFSESDPRIKESLEFFGQKEDQEKIREEWAEERPVLIEAYRLKRKRALRKHNEASKARLWLNNKASRRKNFHPAKRARKI